MVSVTHILQNPMPSPRQTLSTFRDALRAIGSDSLITRIGIGQSHGDHELPDTPGQLQSEFCTENINSLSRSTFMAKDSNRNDAEPIGKISRYADLVLALSSFVFGLNQANHAF